MTQNLDFTPVDLDNPLELALAAYFRKDLYAVATAPVKGAFETKWPSFEAYKRHLASHQNIHPSFVSFVLSGNDVVGHYVLDRHFTKPDTGYLEVLYLTAYARGQGIGDKIIAYVKGLFCEVGYSSMYTVSDETNPKVTTFYQKTGWEDLGRQDDKIPFLLGWRQNI